MENVSITQQCQNIANMKINTPLILRVTPTSVWYSVPEYPSKPGNNNCLTTSLSLAIRNFSSSLPAPSREEKFWSLTAAIIKAKKIFNINPGVEMLQNFLIWKDEVFKKILKFFYFYATAELSTAWKKSPVLVCLKAMQPVTKKASQSRQTYIDRHAVAVLSNHFKDIPGLYTRLKSIMPLKVSSNDLCLVVTTSHCPIEC